MIHIQGSWQQRKIYLAPNAVAEIRRRDGVPAPKRAVEIGQVAEARPIGDRRDRAGGVLRAAQQSSRAFQAQDKKEISSEESRVGNRGVSTGRSRWSPNK